MDHPPLNSEQPDSNFQAAVQKLHELTVYARWLLTLVLWLTVGSWSLWELRDTISLLQQYFTWATLRFGLAYHLLGTIGLSLCIGVTIATLLWQTRNILVGLPPQERHRLEKQVLKIRQQGSSHPLWNWIESQKRRR